VTSEPPVGGCGSRVAVVTHSSQFLHNPKTAVTKEDHDTFACMSHPRPSVYGHLYCIARSKSESGTHSAMLPCKYPGCTSIFYSDAGRRSHFQSKHQARRWHFKYPGCTSHFANASDLRRHERVAHLKLNWDCKHAGCTKSYASVNGLRMHVETKHNHQRFPCTILDAH
jgi:hypothetical protein